MVVIKITSNIKLFLGARAKKALKKKKKKICIKFCIK